MKTLKKLQSGKTIGAIAFENGIALGAKNKFKIIPSACCLEEVDGKLYLTLFDNRLEEQEIIVRHENI